MNILIADCGATSAKWLLTGDTTARLVTRGFNASSIGVKEIVEILQPARDLIIDADRITFYGAGCRPGEAQVNVVEAFHSINHSAEVYAYSDIYASVHALAPRDKAIVSILGTGVNAVVVECGEIIDSVRSTGYILGDYGSGAALGRELMERYVSGRLPRHLTESLENEFGISPDAVIGAVYRGQSPRAFLGSFAPWLHKNQGDAAIARLLHEAFTTYARVSLRQLWERHRVDIRLSGSIAFYFRPVIERAIARVIPQARIGAVVQSPLDHITPHDTN